MQVEERFAIGERVCFIAQNRLLQGNVAREHFDGQIVRVEISRETGVRPTWDIPREQVAPAPKGV